MCGKSLAIVLSLGFAALPATAADTGPSKSKLTAAEIVEKNVSARGGLEAWRAIKTMSLAGKLGAGGNQRATLPVRPSGPGSASASIPSRKFNQQALPSRPVEEVQLPFVMELERPRKMRFELEFNGQTALQVYDGTNGWKLRPFLNRTVVEPYSDDEMKTSSMQAELDGPLVDYAKKGSRIELAGMEKVEDRDTYKVKLTMKNGAALHVWIDALTFLETKIEGQQRRLDGIDHPVEVYFRDYRLVNGLRIPFVLETKVLPPVQTAKNFREPAIPEEKTIIEKVLLNPKFDDSHFSKPENGVMSSATK